MSGPLAWCLSLAAFVGHFSIAVWLFNRLHAVPLRRSAIKVLEKLLLGVAGLVVLAYAARWAMTGQLPTPPQDRATWAASGWWLGYAIVCWFAAAAAIPWWLMPKLAERTPAELAANDTRTLDVAARLGFAPLHGAQFKLWSRFPGNQILQVAVQEKTLRLPRLPAGLDGLRIAHLSDLHMTGHVGREYYDLVVEETNALVPDLVLITGDILEKEACLPWIEATLGRLEARHGKFFILGNHELRLPDPAILRAELTRCGFIDLGSRCQTVTINGIDVRLAGNELPWFGAAPQIDSDPSSLHLHPSSFRILLSHSPDQLCWARSNHFDLMLAGHNHGGQIRLPGMGALIVPSWYGFRYAGGLYAAPPTLLHVSRGLGGIHPIRLNCPPELALLVLIGEATQL